MGKIPHIKFNSCLLIKNVHAKCVTKVNEKCQNLAITFVFYDRIFLMTFSGWINNHKDDTSQLIMCFTAAAQDILMQMTPNVEHVYVLSFSFFSADRKNLF